MNPAKPSLFDDLPRSEIPVGLQFVLASGSDRRRQLLEAAGYSFCVVVPDATAECGICTRETPAETVGRLAYRKSANVVAKLEKKPNTLVLAADTLAFCNGATLGKPTDRDHAEQMLRLLRGKPHSVYTGVCLWSVDSNRCLVDVSLTELIMDSFDDRQLEGYLDSHLWEGKAGAFGYQDGFDWLKVVKGSESNVVGLPMERLAVLLDGFDRLAQDIGLEKKL